MNLSQVSEGSFKREVVSRQTNHDIANVLSTTMTQRLTLPYSFDDFEILHELGHGSSGQTYSVKNKHDYSTVVLKRIPKNRTPRSNVEMEVAVLQKLQPICDDYILCYRGYFEDNSYYYIITEFLGDYVPLQNLIHNLPRLTFRILARNLILGLQNIHLAGITHRDIKPENILINPNTLEIKYIDFGLSCYEGTCDLKRLTEGTLAFMAPELILGTTRPSLEAFQKADIWSLGMILFTMVYGEPLVMTYVNKDIIPHNPHFIGSYPQVFMLLTRFYAKWNEESRNIMINFLKMKKIPLSIQRIITNALEIDPSKRNLNNILRSLKLETTR